MYRDYNEERDDELYHYGRQGMKWGQHVYTMAKNVASRAARSASKNLKAVNEVDRLYQIGTPNEKKLKRLVDVVWDG